MHEKCTQLIFLRWGVPYSPMKSASCDLVAQGYTNFSKMVWMAVILNLGKRLTAIYTNFFKFAYPCETTP